MPAEPAVKRVVTFFDGQNLYRAAKDAFGYHYPNYDVRLLSQSICHQNGWTLSEVRFYTGVPDSTDNLFWHTFWSRKLAVMGTRGINVFSRKLRYRNQIFKLSDGTSHSILVGQEKGIDVRLAIDVVQAVHAGLCDIALVFSQDQDLSEVADEVRRIAASSGRWVKMACAFPTSPTARNRRGIDKTDWLRIDRATYDQCLDPRDYRK